MVRWQWIFEIIHIHFPSFQTLKLVKSLELPRGFAHRDPHHTPPNWGSRSEPWHTMGSSIQSLNNQQLKLEPFSIQNALVTLQYAPTQVLAQAKLKKSVGFNLGWCQHRSQPHGSGGQDFHFPQFPSNFDQFDIFYLKISLFFPSFWPPGWATRPPGKALTTLLVGALLWGIRRGIIMYYLPSFQALKFVKSSELPGLCPWTPITPLT